MTILSDNDDDDTDNDDDDNNVLKAENCSMMCFLLSHDEWRFRDVGY